MSLTCFAFYDRKTFFARFFFVIISTIPPHRPYIFCCYWNQSYISKHCTCTCIHLLLIFHTHTYLNQQMCASIKWILFVLSGASYISHFMPSVYHALHTHNLIYILVFWFVRDNIYYYYLFDLHTAFICMCARERPFDCLFVLFAPKRHSIDSRFYTLHTY